MMRNNVLRFLLVLIMYGAVYMPTSYALSPITTDSQFANFPTDSILGVKQVVTSNCYSIEENKIDSSFDGNCIIVAEATAQPYTAVVHSQEENASSMIGTLSWQQFKSLINKYQWALKTNVAYLAATVANISGEVGFNEHYSIDLPIIYSPYTVARNYRLRFLAIQPEFRYWLDNQMEGHFFGVHLNIGAFNISVDNEKRYQSPDGFYGVGVSYGYVLPFALNWAAEFNIGAGYIHTKYDAYYNIPNGVCYEKDTPYNYWGLTKFGVNLVYRFGK